MKGAADWHKAVLPILKTSSVTWGGAGDAIAAVDDQWRLPSTLLAAAELFDPDIWMPCVPTGHGLVLDDGDSTWCSSRAPAPECSVGEWERVSPQGMLVVPHRLIDAAEVVQLAASPARSPISAQA
jgi:hypothetical protein